MNKLLYALLIAAGIMQEQAAWQSMPTDENGEFEQ